MGLVYPRWHSFVMSIDDRKFKINVVMLNLGGGDLAQNMLEHHLNKHPIECLCKDTKTSPKTSPKNHLKHPIELLCKDTKTSPKISPKISIPVSLQIH